LNLEDVRNLDELIVDGYKDWVTEAPPEWKLDGFLTNKSPIVVTSCFGQNAKILVPGNEPDEAEGWNSERDYSKISFLTFALATSIK
jgi:hypothetical protein